MYNGSKDVYVEAFTALKSKMLELGLTVDLEIFRFAFETASHKAAKEVFPGIEIECCFFISVKRIGATLSV